MTRPDNIVAYIPLEVTAALSEFEFSVRAMTGHPTMVCLESDHLVGIVWRRELCKMVIYFTLICDLFLFFLITQKCFAVATGGTVSLMALVRQQNSSPVSVLKEGLRYRKKDKDEKVGCCPFGSMIVVF